MRPRVQHTTPPMHTKARRLTITLPTKTRSEASAKPKAVSTPDTVEEM